MPVNVRPAFLHFCCLSSIDIASTYHALPTGLLTLQTLVRRFFYFLSVD